MAKEQFLNQFLGYLRSSLIGSLCFCLGSTPITVGDGAQEQAPQEPNKVATATDGTPVVPANKSVAQDVTGEPAEAANAQTLPEKKYKHKKFTNVVYSKRDDYQLLCDIYQPEGTGPFPAVIAIHGGAWSHGTKFTMVRHAWKMASAGYVVVAIDYRLAPKYKFPAQIHDCKQAVRWIRLKQEKLKVNPDQIAVFGYSAGGHLGAMLGTTGDQQEFEGKVSDAFKDISSRVQCVVVGGGPCEFGWIKSKLLTYWLGESPEDDPAVYRQAAPTTYVSKDDPPFMFFHGSQDTIVPPSSSRKLHELLTKQGVESTYHLIEGKGHVATFSDLNWLDDAITFMDSKLNRQHHE